MPLNLNKRINDIDTFLHQAAHDKSCPRHTNGKGPACTCGKIDAAEHLEGLKRALDKMGALLLLLTTTSV